MRTAARSPFLPALHTLTRAGCEKVAGEMFDTMAVRLALATAATQGRTRLFLRPALPIDLRETNAARSLVAHLASLGISAMWQTYSLDEGGRRVTGYELEITWQPDNSAVPPLSEAEAQVIVETNSLEPT